MYGRCETDPFDQATDVCDSCYGEFCSACMVKTKGRKHPVCKECTIIASGVRPGAKPLLRGSKKSAAKRRKALQQAPEESPSFEYFNDAKPVESIDAPTPDLQPDDAGSDATDDHDDPAGAQAATDSSDLTEAIDDTVTEPVMEPDQTDGPGVASVRSVTPGLAALAQHQAERSGQPSGARDDDPASVPAPDWLMTPDEGRSPFADEPIEAEVPAAAEAPAAVEVPATAEADIQVEADVQVEADIQVEADADAGADADADAEKPTGAARQRTPIGDRAKPVTEGFDWVTEMPAKGSSTPLPSRARAEGANDSAEQPPGAVATVEAPAAALPRRRSTLRSPDDDRR